MIIRARISVYNGIFLHHSGILYTELKYQFLNRGNYLKANFILYLDEHVGHLKIICI